MYGTTQTDSETSLSRLKERAEELATELSRTQRLIDSLFQEEGAAEAVFLSGPQIYLQPLRPYDRLRTKWNLGTGLEKQISPQHDNTPPPATVSTSLRLFGLLADGSPWECRLAFEDIARRGGISLGRDPEVSDIVIPDAGVSRCHLVIELTEQGLEVSDRQSTNGTAINNIAFSPYHPHMMLQNGDTLTVGEVMLQAEIIRHSL